jgi:hypothetical protein
MVGGTVGAVVSATTGSKGRVGRGGLVIGVAGDVTVVSTPNSVVGIGKGISGIEGLG